MGTEIEIEYEGDLHCRLHHGPSGAEIVTDAPPDNQGKGEAFSPTDLLAASLGSCIITIMGIYARRKAIDLKGSRVRVSKEMVYDPLRRIGHLLVEIDLPDVDPTLRPALETAGHSCPVERSLHPDLKVDLVFNYGRV
jgi:putative redox protein